MYDVVRAIALTFNFKKLDNIAVAEAMHWAQAATIGEDEDTPVDPNQPATILDIPPAAGHATQAGKGDVEGTSATTHLVVDKSTQPKDHVVIETRNGDSLGVVLTKASVQVNRLWSISQ